MIERQGRTADRIITFGLYMTAVGAVLWLSAATIDYALDARFYYFYLLKWEACVENCTAKGTVFPQFAGDNHEEYMIDLLTGLQVKDIAPPDSNTSKAYVYNIVRINPFEKSTPVFLLAMSNQLVLFNMPETTFKRVDHFVDGQAGMDTGRFLGKYNDNGKTLDCLYKL